jgi:PAS domain S-box-containing protein
MKLNEMFEINRDPEFSGSWLNNQKYILMVLSFGGAAIVLFWQLFDKYYVEALDFRLPGLRFATVGLYLINLAAALVRKNAKAMKQHLIGGFYIGSLYCTLLVAFTGASVSPYWFGLIFIIIAWFVLIPYDFREMAMHSILFLALFVAGQYIQNEYVIINHEMGKIIFLYSGVLFVSFFAAYIRNRLDAENFIVKKESLLKNSELLKMNNDLKKFRLVLDQAPGAVFIMDKYWNFEYINPYFTQLSGYTSEELLHKNIRDTLYKGIEGVPESRREIITNLTEGKNWNGELLTMHKSGGRYWANTIASPFKDENGGIEGYIVIQQDISQKKQMEFSLAEQEKLYRTLIEKSLDGIVISQDGKVILVNKAFADMIGYTIEECIETFGPHAIAPEDRERVMNIHLSRMKGELGDMRYNASLLHKNGEKMIAEFNSTTIEMNGKPASLISVRDITDRIKMQESIEKSERKYKTLVENSLEGITIIRDNRILFANDTYCKMLGYTCEELYNMPSVNTLHPNDHEKAFKIAERRREKDFSTINEVFRMLTKSGEIRECETSSTLVEFEGTWASFFTSHDITENKKIQRALLESEKKYRELTEMLPQTVYELDANGDIIYFNQTGFKQFGLDNSDIGTSSYRFILPDQHDQLKLNIQKTITEKKITFGNKYTAVRKNGETFPALTFASPIIYEDNVVGVRGIILDMTENEAMEKALRESEKKYRELAEMLPQTVYEHDLNGKLTYLNQAGKKTFGIESLEKGISARDLVISADIERMLNNMDKSIFGNSTSRGNSYTAMRMNGEKFPVMIFATPMISEEKITGIRGIVIDMTEYVAMENALKESEEKYRTLIEKAMDGIIITQQGKLKFVNRAFCELIQYSEEELIDKPYLDYVVPDDHQLMKMYHNRRMAGEDFQTMYRSKIYKKDGTLLEVELNARTSEFNNQPSAFIIIRDITDRLHTEEELRKAKTELEMLNQNLEIRVKESTLKLTEANTQLIRLQKENLQSQFEVLRQQVNPHFLFNSLNVLTSLIKLEPNLAEQFTEHLSKVYRYVLENKDNDLVSLQTELDFLDAYIFLLNIRFMDKIVVKVDIGEEKRECQILPLALQLLIENAIKHNAMSKRNPLKIDIFIDDENVLHVENNLQERESHMVSTGVGLRNIAHRYHLLEMDEPEFVKTETKFIARVPLKC